MTSARDEVLALLEEHAGDNYLGGPKWYCDNLACPDLLLSRESHHADVIAAWAEDRELRLNAAIADVLVETAAFCIASDARALRVAATTLEAMPVTLAEADSCN